MLEQPVGNKNVFSRFHLDHAVTVNIIVTLREKSGDHQFTRIPHLGTIHIPLSLSFILWAA